MTDTLFQLLPGLLGPADLAVVRQGLSEADAAASTVSGLADRPVVGLARRSTRLTAPAAIEALLRERLLAVRPRLEALFDRPLGDLEPLQILRYGPGDYFVAHQDGNTPLIHDDTRHRRVSLSLLLSPPEDWTGGALLFHPGQQEAPGAAGDAVAFRAETTHEVTPLEAGQRLSVAAWFRTA
ncbi:2OG-Fe(II) oxygenase [Caulobacter sp. NIBR1757]|uniref:2OG-Fe(II) oxygenase n=1 Tax=Caulobacter sp. NIBR1757 TaxID=3016000 RepID=UPI0022F121C6|nr:2OG-Fe(II) oxygenase [Caulobacter sp. NIBR1757]WGM37892.1 PKHD-type hydroxylase YbiX [Caulobacter sp. NIBR1757]